MSVSEPLGPHRSLEDGGKALSPGHSSHGTKGQGCQLVRPPEPPKLHSCASFPRPPPSSPGQEQPAQQWERAAAQGPARTSRLRGGCRLQGPQGAGPWAGLQAWTVEALPPQGLCCLWGQRHQAPVAPA